MEPAQGASPVEPLRTRLRRSDLWVRVASGIVLAVLALGVARIGGPLFDIFWIAAGVLIFWEWKNIVRSAPHRFVWIGLGILYALIAAIPPIVLRHSHDFGLRCV